MRSTAEMKIVISSDRYENGIAPLLWKSPSAATGPTGRVEDQKRPFEGDRMYFPLRDIIFEIKYVNDIENFYQLKDTYTYELTCEPFEYGEETFDTGVGAIDDDFDDEGYNVTMILGDAGARATASASIVNGGIHKIDIISGGTGYTNAPSIIIEPVTQANCLNKSVSIVCLPSLGFHSGTLYVVYTKSLWSFGNECGTDSSTM